MKSFTVGEKEEGLTVIKASAKLLPGAPSSLLHKFLRNKNIELNGKKADPKRVLKAGDELVFFLSDETYEKFSRDGSQSPVKKAFDGSGSGISGLIVYEDKDVIFINKPAGILTQGDGSGKVSVNDLLLKYLSCDPANSLIKPSVCNRLDMNTSGLLLAGKSAAGLKCLNEALKSRNLKKTYITVVCGPSELNGIYEAFLKKDEKENLSVISDTDRQGFMPVKTGFNTLSCIRFKEHELSVIEAVLYTGRPHQIRAHLKHLGFPVLGDRKYFTKNSLMVMKKLKIKRHLLHSLSTSFPEDPDILEALRGRTFKAALPEDMKDFVH